LKKLIELFSIKKIRGKLFILTTLITIIPMLCLGVAVYQISADRLMKNAENQAFATGEIANHYLDRIIVDLNDLFNVIIGNSQIQCAVTGSNDQVCQNYGISSDFYSEYDYLRRFQKISNALNTITQPKSYVVSYTIFDMTTSIDRRFYGTYISPEQAQKWYSQFNKSDGVLLRNNESFDPNTSLNEERMIIGKQLRRTSGDYGTIGFILLEVDKIKFFEGLSFLNVNRQASFMIADNFDQLLYTVTGGDLNKNDNNALFTRAIETALSTYKFVAFDKGRIMATRQINERSNWSIVHLIDATSLTVDARAIGTIIFWVFIGSLLFGLAMANWISGMIRKPLYRLSLLIKRKATLTPSSFVDFDATDEVGQIGHRVQSMMEEIEELHNQTYNALIKSKKAEIQALQAQINPHFLYNTLESLNGLALSRMQFDMSEIITMLGKFFRATFNKGNEIIPLQNELEHVQAYIRVQNFRYSEKFHFFLSFEDDVSKYHVPKFILQPIVENAINHGLKQQKEQGTIVISGEEQVGVLSLHITDDGQGISPDRLMEISEAFGKEETKLTYGLKNVHDRLRLRYGDHYGVQIASETGLYTTVTLKLPAIKEGEESLHETNIKRSDR
jgi:two-component system sensor histidine kinase YesM